MRQQHRNDSDMRFALSRRLLSVIAICGSRLPATDIRLPALRQCYERLRSLGPRGQDAALMTELAQLMKSIANDDGPDLFNQSQPADLAALGIALREGGALRGNAFDALNLINRLSHGAV